MAIASLRAALMAALFLLAGCDTASQATPTVLEGKTMGTSWRVSVVDITPQQATALQKKIQAQLDSDDWLMSTWKKDSALMRFNRSTSTAPWPVSEAMADIVTTSLRVGNKTDGVMDITVGPLVNLWGFGPDQQPIKTPTQAQIDAAKARTGLQHLTVINRAGEQFLQNRKDFYYVFR